MVKKDLAYKTKTAENPNDYLEQFIDLFKGSTVSISDIKPSDWVQQNVVMGKPFPGHF